MNRFFAQLKLILTIRCERASQLASESFERRLELHERLALRGHQFVCWSCRKFASHLRVLRDTMAAAKELQEQQLESGGATSRGGQSPLEKADLAQFFMRVA